MDSVVQWFQIEFVSKHGLWKLYSSFSSMSRWSRSVVEELVTRIYGQISWFWELSAMYGCCSTCINVAAHNG